MRERVSQEDGKTGRDHGSVNQSSRLPAFLFSLVSLLFACDQPPPAESLKDWTAADHHSSDDDKLAMGMQSRGAEAPKEQQIAQLVEITWRQQCSGCHGAMGKGDGQLGPMVQAPDLTRADWQAKATDAEIAATIKNGKNKMPKFDLPDPVVVGLVERIRQLRGR